jgi:hypothetical protein
MARDKTNRATFYAANGLESNTGQGSNPQYWTYVCGACGNSTSGRILCDMIRGIDGARLMWCLCSCENREPTIFIDKGANDITQLPHGCEFKCSSEWPPEISKLFEEAIKCYSANAHTAATMICRKVLMVCACEKSAEDGKQFAYYVDFITNQILNFPQAKTAIDAIRLIGNDANHGVAFVGADDAKRAMKIVNYMLNTIYSFPVA